jgi:hypothetical protein
VLWFFLLPLKRLFARRQHIGEGALRAILHDDPNLIFLEEVVIVTHNVVAIALLETEIYVVKEKSKKTVEKEEEKRP